MTIRRMSLAAGLVLAAAGCSNEHVFPLAVPQYAGGAMFQRYVAMGNSITAGFQSGGINDSTQQQSYVGLVAADPTCVSVWAGNNDVLGAATSSANAGDSTLITPVATFQTTYTDIVDSVSASGASAILIGIANVTAIPFFSAGQTYFALKN